VGNPVAHGALLPQQSSRRSPHHALAVRIAWPISAFRSSQNGASRKIASSRNLISCTLKRLLSILDIASSPERIFGSGGDQACGAGNLFAAILTCRGMDCRADVQRGMPSESYNRGSWAATEVAMVEQPNAIGPPSGISRDQRIHWIRGFRLSPLCHSSLCSVLAWPRTRLKIGSTTGHQKFLTLFRPCLASNLSCCLSTWNRPFRNPGEYYHCNTFLSWGEIT
jgi:hypothetical protein